MNLKCTYLDYGVIYYIEILQSNNTYVRISRLLESRKFIPIKNICFAFILGFEFKYLLI